MQKVELFMYLADQKIELWKNRLLDLSKRNRLLNYKQSKRSTLSISKPSIYDLWKIMVLDDKNIEFPTTDEDQPKNANFEWSNNSKVVTDKSVIDTQKTLRNLRAKAKTAIEEQGVNILYLSFGFLKWKDNESSDNFFLSPIILVPVRLTVDSIFSPYILELYEDEILVNPTLMYKLTLDFGITLPDFDQDTPLESYFNEVESRINNNSWAVIPEVGLSMLSFLKINMYHDLVTNKERIINNKIVCTITGDLKTTEDIPEFSHGFDHDKKSKPVDLFQVVDADSSQMDAIELAKLGVSFVLQGPPGTGKSQTITNIISESIASGKKVLFVSEKMAALDVVRKRLTKANLSDYCLNLHSYKANKKYVLEQFAKMQDLSKKQASISSEAFQKLDMLQEDKEKLNDYTNQLFQVVKPLEKTIFQVNGYLAQLEKYENVIFSLDNVENATQQDLNKQLNFLSQYSSTIAKMPGKYNSNPWFDSIVPSLTNELRHDINHHLPKMIEYIRVTDEIFDNIKDDYCYINNRSYKSIDSLLEILKVISKSTKAPTHWVYEQDHGCVRKYIDTFSNLQKDFYTSMKILEEINNKINSLGVNFSIHVPSCSVLSTEVTAIIDKVQIYLEQDYCYSTWQKIQTNDVTTAYEKISWQTTTILGCRNKITANYYKDVFDVDYKAILLRFRTDYKSFFKFFKSVYWKDMRHFRSLSKNMSLRVNENEVIDVLMNLQCIEDGKEWFNANRQYMKNLFGDRYKEENTDLISIKRMLDVFSLIVDGKNILKKIAEIKRTFEENDEVLKKQFEFIYNGVNTQWDKASMSLNWVESFNQLHKRYDFGNGLINIACSDDQKIARSFELMDKLNAAKKNLNFELEWYLELFNDKERLKHMPLSKLSDMVGKGLSSLSSLEEWIDYRNAWGMCNSAGLSGYIEKVESLNLDSQCIVPVFKKRFYRLWLDKILPKYPAVLEFRRSKQEKLINEFVELDRLQLNIAIARINKKLIDSLPSFDRITSGVDEIGILKRELSKQRRIMPIRKLFKEIPNLILALKPCLMMSPLSVSLYLESESYIFDLVIFDEASQICTENAIGAISRGKQVILVGDSKQLPPTSFFNTSVLATDYDSDLDDEMILEDDYQSILEEAESSALISHKLLWHYRSKNENLIVFSNRNFYNNNLITFPSINDRTPGNGVEYIYVENGFYDRGGKKGNVIEAERVVDLVIDHFKKTPDRSLGVIAFGEVQQQTIESVLRQRRKSDLSFEEYFKEDREEPFFVKNIENVQGDERDTIIFSIGYAKDENGKFQMNFGPLNKSGGQRRLNVAITRSKYNLKLVGSILPADIDEQRINSEGPKLLKAYINYALNGTMTMPDETLKDNFTSESPFETAVSDFIESHGYKIDTQVGCSSYRIDIAVKHPTISDRYVIGIECDGETYHSTRIARERDRIRQDVLEDNGWRIYRIWSTDWIKDVKTEGQKLIDEIEKAINEHRTEINIESKAYPGKQDESDFIRLNQKNDHMGSCGVNEYGFQEQRETTFDEIPRDYYGYMRLDDCVKEIIDNEYPVHYEIICRKVAPLMGNEKKTTTRIKREVDRVLRSVKGVSRKGDFFYPEKYVNITPRTIGNTRLIHHISPDELAEAMYAITLKSFGIIKESLMNVTSKEFGFSRSGERIQAAMLEAYEVLLSSKRVKEVDGKVVINT